MNENQVQSIPTWESAQAEILREASYQEMDKPPPPPQGMHPSSKLSDSLLTSAKVAASNINADIDGSLESALEFLDAYDWEVPSASSNSKVSSSVMEKGELGGSKDGISSTNTNYSADETIYLDALGAPEAPTGLDEFDAYYELLTTPTKTIPSSAAPLRPEILVSPSVNAETVSSSLETENSENSVVVNQSPERTSFETEAQALKQDLLNMQSALQARMERYNNMTPASPSL